MSYTQKDLSVQDGEPVEFYKFSSPLGVFRYTSDNKPGMCNGELYEVIPGGIERTSVETGSVVDTVMTMDFIIPADSDVAKLYCYQITPEDLIVEVRRAHRGDDWATEWEMEWIGLGLDTSVSKHLATIRTGSILQAKLSGNVATVYYQRMCNHTLFDARCKINRADWTFPAVVTKVQRQLITVDNDNAHNGTLKGGELKILRTGEGRTIHDNQDDLITISYPFGSVEVGDAVELTFGCNRARLGDCKLRFDNAKNFGGFPFIPVTNPFTDLKFDGKIITKIKEDYYTRQSLIVVNS